jgi:signal transduction histidine kinase/CheY-like chemotaxis protein
VLPNGISIAVRTEQLRAVFRQMPIGLAVNLVNAALTAVVIVPIAASSCPIVWFFLVAVVSVGRLILWRQYRRSLSGSERDHIWSRLAVCGSLLAGSCWGFGGMLLFPIVPTSGQIFLTFVIGGMCAGAVVLSASHLPTLLAFLLSASLPMAVRFLVEGTVADSALGAMVVVFATALSLAGAHLNRFFTEAMRLRFELDEANLRLRSEMAEHRATEAALRQSQKLEALGQLTGGIAHDFNNLLTVVIGNVILASRRASDDSNILPLLQSALRSAERGVALIQRLLAFARKQHLDPQSVDLGALVASIEDLLQRTVGPAIRLEIATDASLAPALVDANQVELAILNLAINARDAMPVGGTLCISLHNRRADYSSPPGLTAGDYVLVSISDTGTGMDDATLAQACDPFFTTKEVGSGSGLGLPMVQGFAGQSGGAVQIRSKLGEGTTVEIWLPQAVEPPLGTSSANPSGSAISQGMANILLCDDDHDVRRFLSELLKSDGYTVHEASTPEGAFRILEDGAAVDLLIVDYAMPEINGMEIIRRAWRKRPSLRTLLITGDAGAAGIDAAGAPLLRKPFRPAEFSQTVATLLAVYSVAPG